MAMSKKPNRLRLQMQGDHPAPTDQPVDPESMTRAALIAEVRALRAARQSSDPPTPDEVQQLITTLQPHRNADDGKAHLYFQEDLDAAYERGKREGKTEKRRAHKNNAIEPFNPSPIDQAQYVTSSEAINAIWAMSDLTHASIRFQQALSDLRAPMWAIEALATGNGGDKTAAAIAHYNDLLVAALNQLERATVNIRKAGVGEINPLILQELISQCTGLRAAANRYAGASNTARVAIHEQIRKYVKTINPLLERVYSPPKHYTPDMKIAAEMLTTRVNNGLEHKEAIEDVLRSAPDLGLRFFGLRPGDEIPPDKIEHSRQLVHRLRLGLL